MRPMWIASTTLSLVLVVTLALQPPTPQPAGGAPAQLVEQARQDLARRLGVSAAQIAVGETKPMTWSSLALGCPAPGRAYAAVETPGFQVVLTAFGQRHTYHANASSTFVLCVQGEGIPDSQVASASGLLAGLLERGLRVEVLDAYAELPFLRADGTRYRVTGGAFTEPAEIQVYDYRDAALAAEDAAQIGSDGQPAGSQVAWGRPPRFFRSGSVIAITFDGQQPLVDMLDGLLGPSFAGDDAATPSVGPGAMPPAPGPPGGPIPGSMPPADPSFTRISWEEAKALIMSGAVQEVFQAHSLEVRLKLKDGRWFVTTETRIDEVFEIVRSCGAPCAQTMIATE
jgi:hypothetical protein